MHCTVYKYHETVHGMTLHYWTKLNWTSNWTSYDGDSSVIFIPYHGFSKQFLLYWSSLLATHCDLLLSLLTAQLQLTNISVILGVSIELLSGPALLHARARFYKRKYKRTKQRGSLPSLPYIVWNRETANIVLCLASQSKNVVKLLSGESHRTPFKISQHWFSWWLDSQPSIAWANVDTDLCHHMASLVCNKMIYRVNVTSVGMILYKQYNAYQL